MDNCCNSFPFKYWKKAAFVEFSLEGRKGNIIIAAAEVRISYYGTTQLFILFTFIKVKS